MFYWLSTYKCILFFFSSSPPTFFFTPSPLSFGSAVKGNKSCKRSNNNKNKQQPTEEERMLNCGECDAKRVMASAFLFSSFCHFFPLSSSPKDDNAEKVTFRQRREREREGFWMEKKMNKWKVMFQNDKTAIYEFIFIDHIVFIFTGFLHIEKRKENSNMDRF